MKIVVATTTRADWGLLSPLATALRERGDEVLIFAANMHFIPELGLTFNEILKEGFQVGLRCYPHENPAVTAANCLVDFSRRLSEVKPDCIICLGDRFEMLAIAQAAVMTGVPIVHIAGGAVSQGATDDYFRNAITKMSWLHFTECEQYRLRVIQMGEDPERVYDTGAIGIHNILSIKPIPLDELEADLNFKLDRDTLICTMHAATRSPIPATEQYDCLLAGIEKAFSSWKNLRILFTYPNNDVDPAPLISRLKQFAAKHPERVRLIPSLGMKRYISALHYCAGVIGNSSSGIVEVASTGIPVLDIGPRQQGRMHGPAVFHAPCETDKIAEGILHLSSPEAREIAARKVNPYAKSDTLALMLAAITPENFSHASQKEFYDLCDTSI